MTVAPVHIDEGLTLARQGGGWRPERPRDPRAVGRARRARGGGGRRGRTADGRPGGRRRAPRPRPTRASRASRATRSPGPARRSWPRRRCAAGSAAQPVWAGGALVRSAQMAGGLEFLLAQSVKYVTERKQFGRPLAAFQAIQQNLALLAGHTAAAGMAAQQAFHVVERTGEGGDAGIRDRGGEGSHRRGGGPRRGHRAPGPRRHRLHLRALAALRHAAALVLAGRVRRGDPLVGGAGSRGRARAAPTRSGRI